MLAVRDPSGELAAGAICRWLPNGLKKESESLEEIRKGRTVFNYLVPRGEMPALLTDPALEEKKMRWIMGGVEKRKAHMKSVMAKLHAETVPGAHIYGTAAARARMLRHCLSPCAQAHEPVHSTTPEEVGARRLPCAPCVTRPPRSKRRRLPMWSSRTSAAPQRLPRRCPPQRPRSSQRRRHHTSRGSRRCKCFALYNK